MKQIHVFCFFLSTVIVIRTFLLNLLVGSVGLPAGASSGGASGRVVKNYHLTSQEKPFLQISHKNILRNIVFDDSTSENFHKFQ